MNKLLMVPAIAVAFVSCGGSDSDSAEPTPTPTVTSAITAAPSETPPPETAVPETAAPETAAPETAAPGPTVSVPPGTVGVAAPNALYPKSISGRKLLDQNGDPILIKSMSSWSMAVHLTDAEITTELTALAALGFNSVTVFPWGSDYPALYSNWNDYTSSNGDLFTGTPFQSDLDIGWESMDWIVSESDRLGMFVNFSFGTGFDNSFAGDEMIAASDAQMVAFGEAVATRYLAWDNIVWHVMFDQTVAIGSTLGQRVESLFEGINNIEGSRRPVRWLEVGNGQTTAEGGWFETTQTNATIDAFYEYQDDSANEIDAVYGDSTNPVMDSEPPYVGAPHYGGNEGQQLRERTWSVFLRGGIGINFGHEDYWPFGRSGLYTAGLDWDEVVSSAELADQSYAWDVIDAYVNDTAWAPTDVFVTTGEGTGDTRAAAGSSGSAAIAYFPTSRTIEVDTTILTGSDTVLLRWFDPSDGSYSVIAAEAQQTGRSVRHPGTNSDGQDDWVLVAELYSGQATSDQ